MTAATRAPTRPAGAKVALFGRRLALIGARFFGAAANFGFLRALRLYSYQQWSDRKTSVYVPQLGSSVWFRGRSDYFVLTLLFETNFYLRCGSSRIRTVVDLGANIGTETLRFVSFYPEARIIAVEADPDNFRVLEENTRPFPRVQAIHAAAWSEPRRFRIRKSAHSNQATTVVEDPLGEIPGITIVGLIDQLGVSEVDVLKIDVEGAEDALFSRSADEWIGRVKIIVWELNDHEAHGALTRLVQAMRRAGVEFDFHIRGEKLVGVRRDVDVRVLWSCGLAA